MGTSSSRRAPGGRPWRRVKAFAGRYASGAAAAPQVAEVVAHYCQALGQESPETIKGRWSATLATASSLAAFYQTWIHQGWSAALAGLGVEAATGDSKNWIWLTIVDRLAGSGASLAQATARAALLDHFLGWRRGPGSAELAVRPPKLAELPGRLVDYLGRALAAGLAADLGEILEYRAPTASRGHHCYLELREEIASRLAAMPPLPDAAEISEIYVDSALATMIRNLSHDLERP